MDTRVKGTGVNLTKRLFEDPQKYLPVAGQFVTEAKNYRKGKRPFD